MPKIDETSLLESLLSMPFVTNVTLETRDDNGNHLNQISNNNPHVQEEDNQQSSTQGTKNLASINLVVKDYSFGNKILPTSASPIYTLNDPKNYFSLTMFGVGSKDEFEKVTDDNFIKNFVKKGNFSEALIETYGGTDASLIIESFQDKSRTIGLNNWSSAPSDDNDEFKSLKKFRTYDPKTNMQIYNIPYKTEMFFERDLYLVSFVHIDRQKISDLFADNLSLDSLPLVHSRLSINKIVVDGTVNNTKTIFLTRKGEVWQGDYITETNGQGKVIGYKTAPSDNPLTTKVISNNIVQDMRKIDRAEPLSLDFKSLENDVYSFLKFNVPKDNVKLIIGTSSHISNLMMTTDKTGVNKLIFSINFRKLLRDNTSFSSFLNANSGKTTVRKILKNSPIASIRVTRRRIKNKFIDNRAAAVGSSQSNYQSPNKYATEENETPELIVSTSDHIVDENSVLMEKTHSRIKKVSVVSSGSPGGTQTINTVSLSEPVGRIKEITDIATLSPDDNIGIRHFAVTDISCSEITAGEYQYSIDIVMKNGLKEHLQKLIENFKINKLDLEKYYNLAVGASVASGKTNMHYDILYQKFTNSFKEKAQQIPDNLTGTRFQRVITSISKFVDLLELFYSSTTELGSIEKSALFAQLYTMCSPDAGSPRGIESVLNMMSKLIDSMSIFMGGHISTNKQGSTGASNNSSPSKTSSQNMVVFHHDFNNLFKIGIAKHMGYDCLSLAGQKPVGVSETAVPLSNNSKKEQAGSNDIRTITLFDMDLRSKEENSKFFVPGALQYNTDFVDPTPGNYNFNIQMNQKGFFTNKSIPLTTGEDPETRAYSYLTPSIIYLPGYTENSARKTTSMVSSPLGPGNINLKAYKNILLQIIRTNIGKSSVGTADLTLKIGNTTASTKGTDWSFISKMKNILSSRNCVVAEKSEDITTDEDHNKMIENTNSKLKLIEKTVANVGLHKTEIKTMYEDHPDYDKETGQFLFSNPLLKESRWSQTAMEYSLMKHFLPTKHDGGFPDFTPQKETINHYNLNSGGAGKEGSFLYERFQFILQKYPADRGAKIARELDETPNQIKSLIHAATGQLPGSNLKEPSLKSWLGEGLSDPLKDLTTYAYYYFNYKSIFRVEVLTGYENSGDVVSPVWETMTSDLLSELFSLKDNALCRLIKWTGGPIIDASSLFNVRDTPEDSPLHMPLYDQYFVIKKT